jgi:hypothetical protein
VLGIDESVVVAASAAAAAAVVVVVRRRRRDDGRQRRERLHIIFRNATTPLRRTSLSFEVSRKKRRGLQAGARDKAGM